MQVRKILLLCLVSVSAILSIFLPAFAADYDDFVATPNVMWSEYNPSLTGKTGRFKNQGQYPCRVYIGTSAPTGRNFGEILRVGEMQNVPVTIASPNKVYVSEGCIIFFREVAP